MEYRVDLRDLKFQLFEWLPVEELLATGAFGDWDRDSLEMALDEALRIAGEAMSPTQEDGDRLGAVLEGGEVTVPDSFKTAYRAVAEGGWVGAVNNPEYGGLGLPHCAANGITELYAGSGLALTLVFLLTRGAGEVIELFGDDELRRLYCEKLYTGQWTGTMCLTEPQAGTDVGASTTKATPQGDGSYLISGEKIFITFGDHDLTENVAHAVLARLPDAPEGTRGLSLFLVPKVRVLPDGGLGEPNDVICGGIEHKMGIHGSPTCSMLFGREGRCQGFLLGRENQGMKLMFHMMNTARLEVGLQAQAVAAAAHQSALEFARERIQSRHWSQAGDPSAGPVAIVEHPDVRRTLVGSQAMVEAMRGLLLKTGWHIDRSRVADGEDAALHGDWVEILTPVCKAWCSDWGFRVTEWCLQAYGGYGYTRDYPAEQYLRDIKITSIYEGTNGIQALDLVARKLGQGGGRPFLALLEGVKGVASGLGDDPRLASAAPFLTEAVDEVERVASLMAADRDAIAKTLLNATPFLNMLGHTLGGSILLEQARLASGRLAAILAEKGLDPDDDKGCQALVSGDQEAAFFHNKIQTALHYAHRFLPEVRAMAAPFHSGDLSPLSSVL